MIREYVTSKKQALLNFISLICGITLLVVILPLGVNTVMGVSEDNKSSLQSNSVLLNESMINATANTSAVVSSSPEQIKNISIIPGSSFPSNVDFYDPKTLSIFQGSTVRWINDDSAIHTVTSGKGLSDPSNGVTFDSGNLLATQVFEYQFNEAGTYDYFCALHPFMTGKIVVTSIQ